ncbi:MAG: M1 family aminopeptidase [Bacteroidota bacterium]
MRFFLLFFSLSLGQLLPAQTNYFQQEVNYKIDVQLNDETHALIGTIEMEYINNSPDELTEIYMHLWPNAYSTKETAFAKQKERNGSTRFFFAKEEDLGGLSNLDFQIDGQKVAMRQWENHPDVVVLTLPKALKSGERMEIRTPFTLDIPASFSRLGHIGKSYQLTQWYPKPAVYDRKGWHPMPYLDQGEFYSEFGSFDVRITLPDNYVVGATGDLQTRSEYDFLKEREIATRAFYRGEETYLSRNDFPKTSTKMKTLRYTAERVHDFAIFADREFKVLKDSVILESGKLVDTWAMFTTVETDLWEDATKYLNRSVKFYSDYVGEYPYPHATAVQSALSAGAGMEYPMITVIGKSRTDKALDNVITHEVGHNWFYGILAFNERIHPWMDEGINSYYENRYMDEYYEGSNLPLPSFLKGESKLDLNEISYLLQARQNLDQAPDTPSDAFTNINYGISAYTKPTIIFNHLEAYVGTEQMDKAMQTFYDQWKFKHPYPEDLRASLEESLDQSLDWVFDDMLYSKKKLDYAITKVEQGRGELRITVKNKGDIVAPFPVAAISEGEVAQEVWYEGVEDEKVISFPRVGYEDLVIDVERQTMDVNRKDNRKRNPGLAANFGFQIDDSRKQNVSLFPAIAWNNYDGVMLGLGLHNKTIPFRNLEFAVAPMYAFNAKRLSGVGGIRYNIYPKADAVERISLQLNGRTFSYNYLEDSEIEEYYTKWSPEIEVRFGRPSPTSKWSQQLSYRYINIGQFDLGREDPDYIATRRGGDLVFVVNEVNYQLKNDDALTPSLLSTTFEQSSSYSKIFGSFSQSFPYNSENKGLDIRLFGGYFFNFDASRALEDFVRPSFLLGGNTSNTFQEDYLYDQVLLGRSEVEGLLSRQVFMKDANFKTLTSVGTATNWMLSGNVRSSLPKIPVDLFADLAYASPEKGEGDFYYSTGAALSLANGLFEIYVPILESDLIQANHDAQGREGFFQRVTFRLDLTRLNLLDITDNLGF